jgi:hypothetical protein
MVELQTAFELLYSELRHYHDGLYDGAYKVVGSLLLIIGWIITSDTARRVLQQSKWTRWAAIVCIVVCFVGAWALASQLYGKSAHTAKMLDSLNYIPREYYEDRIITKPTLTIVVVIIGVIILVTLWVIYCASM